MQGCVDLCYVNEDQLGIEPATCQSQVQCPTAAPPCNTNVWETVQDRNVVTIDH